MALSGPDLVDVVWAMHHIDCWLDNEVRNNGATLVRGPHPYRACAISINSARRRPASVRCPFEDRAFDYSPPDVSRCSSSSFSLLSFAHGTNAIHATDAIEAPMIIDEMSMLRC